MSRTSHHTIPDSGAKSIVREVLSLITIGEAGEGKDSI
jgi:hypothetical protein